MPVPLRLIVSDPDGNESREYCRHLITEDGAVRHALLFAVNDLRGEWTIAVDDVLTGAKARKRTVQLR
jgi:hypothetical protein